MPFLLKAIIAAFIIVGVWQLVIFLLKSYRKSVDCPACEGKGYYWGVREKETCDVCFGTGKRR